MDATRASELLFGRKCRLAVAAWVLQHPKGRFFQSEPRGIEHASPSNVLEELNRLVRLGMLEVERPDDSRRVYYVRTNSKLWDIIATAIEAIDAEVD
ncbi:MULTISPECIES: hypothetical protein [Mycobacterium]|uniref:hypothetical protein n=1 Tax=Mycobacterium TaxID=1763 RepID=UPI0005EE15A3|nr:MULTISPECIES: hypothetical protein [Mycobacterium]MCV7034911.1 hypothetical protein [Mycobacterium heckeshornense]